MERLTLDIPEVARILGIGVSTAYVAVRRGDIPALRYGKRYVVPIIEVERLIGQPLRESGGIHTTD